MSTVQRKRRVKKNKPRPAEISYEGGKSEGGFLPAFLLAYNVSKLIPLRKRFSNRDEAFLTRYGGMAISSMRVCRTPLANAIGKGLNLLTLGSWEKAIAKYGYDKMFHLFLLIDIIDYRTERVITVKYEKNEVPMVNEFKDPLSNQTETMPVEKQFDGRLFDFITKAQKSMGTKFWDYDAFRNNCQDFLLGSLGANELLTANLQTFIKQDVEAVVREIPQYTTGVAKAVTDTARRIRTLFGRGLKLN